MVLKYSHKLRFCRYFLLKEANNKKLLLWPIIWLYVDYLEYDQTIQTSLKTKGKYNHYNFQVYVHGVSFIIRFI